MSSDLHLSDISDLNLMLLEGNVEFQDILTSCYTKIKSNELEIRAWKYIIPRELQHPTSVFGPLSGLCLGVKDIFATIEAPTSMGTDFSTWKGTQGSFDARIIAKIKGAGATIIGKNKTSEFAVHEPTDTINPRNHRLIPGTSSSGGAAAVAAGHVSISIASQTAGSIARPASYCGVIGFKPSYGELPRTGVLKTTESFDTVGLIGNSVSNISTVFEVARVQDLNHPLHLKRASFAVDELRVMLAIGPLFDDANAAVRASAISLISSLTRCKNLIDLTESSIMDFEKLRTCHEVIYAKELSYFLREELDSKGISEGLKAFGKFGNELPENIYKEQLHFLKSQRDIADSEMVNSVIFALSAADEAPQLGAPDLKDANLMWTALGLPQISLPLLSSQSGNPIGISIIGLKGSDSHLLKYAKNLFAHSIK